MHSPEPIKLTILSWLCEEFLKFSGATYLDMKFSQMSSFNNCSLTSKPNTKPGTSLLPTPLNITTGGSPSVRSLLSQLRLFETKLLTKGLVDEGSEGGTCGAMGEVWVSCFGREGKFMKCIFSMVRTSGMSGGNIWALNWIDSLSLECKIYNTILFTIKTQYYKHISRLKIF